MRLQTLICLLCWILILNSCTDNIDSSANNQAADTQAQTAVDTFVVEPEANSGDLADLFTFHQKLNLNANISFDVLGVGTPNGGNYLILKSDKKKNKYTSITGDKEGQIVQAYATDMDADQQIEVIIAIKSMDNRKGTLIIHEIDSLNNQTKITLPELTTEGAQGYQGQDTFYVKGNKIIREFSVRSSSTSTGTSNSRRIEYVLKNNAFLPSAQGEK